MNKKGFTFIELIAIILVLGAICLVSFPTILNMAKQSDKNTYEEYKKTVCLASQTYIDNDYEITDDINIIEVSIDDLVDLGYLDSNLINPKTDKKVTEENDTVIVTINSDKSLDCSYE